jgi:adenosylhomocysteine nucleosidase
MAMRLTILGALPREISYIIKNLGATKSSERWPFPVYLSAADSVDIAIVQTGMGMIRAASAMNAVLAKSTPDCIVSVGFAGALYNGAVPGELVTGSRFFIFRSAGKEPTTSSSFMQSEVKPDQPLPEPIAERLSGMASLREGSIITLEQALKKTILAEQIPEELPFPVCDMETFTLARLSLESNLPFLAVRSISDTLNEEIPPELIGVVDETGQPKLGTLFHAVTTNPALVTDVLRLKRNSEAAAKNLGLFIEELCQALPRQ